MTSLRTQMRYLNAYELHRLIINEYVLKRPGDTRLFERDKSKDKTDYHVIKEHHRFLWDDNNEPDTWEEQFAKKYYEKLFKEYCIADLCLYKENKVALRWRIAKEVVSGKGQFICGNKICDEKEDLRSWEVNFGYQEKGERKNALVKIRLCPKCSKKLNYHSKKREIKRLSKKNKSRETGNLENKKSSSESTNETESLDESCKPSTSNCDSQQDTQGTESTKESPWENHKPAEVKSREEEMEEYLQDLLL